MCDGPKCKYVSPREVFNLAILGEYLVIDTRPEARFRMCRVPCAQSIPPGICSDKIDEMIQEGDLAADTYRIVAVYSEDGDEDAVVHHICDFFNSHDSTEQIWILRGGFAAFEELYGKAVCSLEDSSVIYPGTPKELSLLFSAPQWPALVMIADRLVFKAHVDDDFFIFLSGEYVSKTRQIYRDLSITHVLNVAKEADNKFQGDHSLGLQYLQLAVIDDDSQNISDTFSSAIAFIGDALRSGGRVLVHCVEGKSRSPVICAAFLMKMKALSATDAMAQLKAARPIVSPNRGFLAQLNVFEQLLRDQTEEAN